MEEPKEGGAAKVGAGGTAVRDETSVWLFEAWEKLRKRDQAALDALNARIERIARAARAREQWLRLLSLMAGVLCGALGAAAYFSIGG